jgi:drug/metabolite transporter (DMT)-like permease
MWFAIALTGIFGTAVAFLVQTRAQQQIPPSRTAVILTGEPVFAGIFGYLVAGDRLSARAYLGAVLIVVGILVAELLAPADEVV